MKSLFYFLVLVFFSVNISFSQEPTQCLHTENISQDTIPNYMQPWWNQIRTGKDITITDPHMTRWNLLFDSLGIYYGTAHPDNASHGDTAYGSMKQYWEEASNGKFDLIPYQTRTPDPYIDNRLWRGIINDYEMVDGIPVIKNIMLPKTKYGEDSLTSYSRRR